MTETTWRILHIDVSLGPLEAPASRGPHLLVFWWGSLPLGSKVFLADEPPFDMAQMRALCSRLAVEQWKARSPSLSLPRAGVDAAPLGCFGLSEAVRAADLLETLDGLAAPARGSAEALSVVVCTRDRP